MDAHSFTAGADYRIYAATMTGFSGGSADTLRDVVASNGTTVLETDGEDVAIGSVSNTGDAIVAMVVVDLERGVPEWKVIAESGVFTGSFIITL